MPKSSEFLFRLRAIAFVCVASAIILFACKRPETKQVIPNAPFLIAKSSMITPLEDLRGQAAARTVVEIRPQVNGELDAQLFNDGSQVIGGQPLFQIDRMPYQTAYDSANAVLQSAQANLDLAEAKVKRSTDLLKQSAISMQDYEIAEAAYKQATTIVAQQKANLATAQFNLNNTTIRSPISGYIGRALVAVGSLVTAYQANPLATIHARDPIYIDIPVCSSRYAALKQMLATDTESGDPHLVARVRLLFDDGTPYPQRGIIQMSNVSFDIDTGKVLLRAVFPNHNLSILPGMNVHVIYSHRKQLDVILVPKRAVRLNKNGDTIVFIIDKRSVARQRAVSVSRAIGDNLLIESGLAEGERVIGDTPPIILPDKPVHAVPLVQ
jgi:RND family efflux transporter MFP subunit